MPRERANHIRCEPAAGGRLQAVTANLACGGPHGVTTEQAALAWIAELGGSEVALVFLQETPVGARAVLEGVGFQVFAHPETSPTYRCRSLVAVRGLDAEMLELDTAGYHGSYLAAATVMIPSVGPVGCISLHASPNRFADRYRASWPGELPVPRIGDGSNLLWDSDLVLATVLARVQLGQVLAAGDWNESRAWDLRHRGTWGAEFFARVSSSGLVDSLQTRWGGERATRGDQQIDHVFASPAVNEVIHEPSVEAGDQARPGASDHAPIFFLIRDACRDRATGPRFPPSG